ncbi:iron-siderophore ABC transporter substrate-binding protein [Chlorogloeopsis sp. ULAP01]|uniref:iron-siderophore ABC transporter substrate-binding protein n=1 Tax=Chlorogloeopsis sp. ULAP01 TaxID=3056483 RepID=UPI0025AABE62|nr:iron-siderophore ABC transporter substrate-binding protein [Chlorogloeopsis sp. ULAP01]MDM9385821.1 iron-siderophore ABC transporter substrate-binding protein [Chlorogloeopsis sp. ULAP01]
MIRWTKNWMEFCGRSLRRFVSYGSQPHPNPPFTKGREPIPTSLLLIKGGLKGVKQQLLLALLTIGIVSGCSSTAIEYSVILSTKPPPLSPCRVVEHLMGKTCVPDCPKRVIILSPYSLLSNALTLGIKPIGSSVHSIKDLNANYPREQAHLGEEIERIQQIGLATDPNLEKILLLKPDLILAWEGAKAIYPLLSQIAPTVVVPSDMPNWKEPKWKDQFSFVAEVLGKEAVAQKVMNKYYQRLEELKVALGNRYQNQTISVASAIGYNNFTFVKNSFIGSILDELGLQRPPAQNVVAPNGAIYNISEERLEILDGDILFFPVHNIGAREAYEKLKHKPLWKKLKAVQKGQVYLVDFWAWIVWDDPSAANAVIDDLYKYLVNAP